ENGANPANCDTATATVLVVNAIDAVGDDFTGTPVSMGGSTPSVVSTNDTLDGLTPVIGTNPGEVTLTGVSVPAELTLNPDGTITVNANTPSGTYSLDYRICENGANPANCDTATATVLVVNAIDAVDDGVTTIEVNQIGPISGGSVLGNDTLNGVLVTISNTNIAPTTSGPLSIDVDGNVTIAANTPAGTYSITYELCEEGANPANCDTATISYSIITDSDGDGVLNIDELFPPNGETPTNPNDPCSYNRAHITLPVTTTADCTAEIKVVKIADFFGKDLGDSIDYTITVENTGNVAISNLVLVENFIDAQGNVLNLTTPVTFQSASLGSIAGTLLVGETATYTASFTITQQAINAGGVSNSVVASGIAPNGSSINDMSDDGDDLDGNSTDDPTVTQLGCLIVFNEFSPNEDGTNDTFVIGCIENYPNNKLEIYNRWGNIVYQKRGYNNEFNGTSNGRATMNVSEKLPVGTYYYILDLGDGSKPKVGWLYINR
ncbi:MAG: gliding motility-associated C-terminal domain-containing protein, partial [Confluentibacter sp.]|nr:gliding motility-associated C-terminal domain-containing protein [Confluentibacter sp.]